ncbi:spermidine/putrescine ABC transporter substrate-binding protein [Mycoplasma wenyonii str. Massachusetts]|uniref:Spermidine/putrescine ABC transporter substrate-binding protein n=1 Tax=Mycoplasma wenyonii (strain Massachusetts) TaxID=1197325 RepID=I6ZIN5_MYCWM|nr:spermidine/putrescine ABC transporter substrate-binding protein [Mycoplasma wenyonii]AFN65050.1 spermidine/putrescine ABC transporter substrate-binding protein [Mycoplasma wenyonii str. Massachusetts]
MGFFTKFFLLPSSASLVIPVSVVTTNTNLSNELVLATYQSYILDSIADEAYNDYNLKTIYFENDKEVFNGFASGAFDLAVLSSSTLEEAIDKGLVRQIDWMSFNGSVRSQLKGINGHGTDGSQVANKLGELYSPVIKEFFTKNSKLATHGVPYFLSYLAFAYSGKKELGDGDGVSDGESGSTTMKPMGWKELIQKITEDKRFKTVDDRPKLGMVEDELTLFSLSKLSSQDSQGGEVTEITNLFKDKENKKSEKDFFDSFMKINAAGIKKGDQMGSRPVFFSPDSVVLSNALSKGELNGIFFYNGDALYAHTLLEELKMEEGQEEGQEEGDDEKQINIVPLNPALWLLDSIAISAKVSEEKLTKIYEFLEKISFDNLDKLQTLKREKVLAEDEEGEGAKETEEEEGEEEQTTGWLIDNYNEIMYTPALKTFNQWIKGKLPSSEGGGGGGSGSSSSGSEDFYKKEMEFLYGNPDIEDCLEKKSKSRKKRDTGEQQCNISIVFEGGLSDAQNLNLTMAFERWKNGF